MQLLRNRVSRAAREAFRQAERAETADALEEALAALAGIRPAQGDAEIDRRLREVRHRLGERLLAEAGARPQFATPDAAGLRAANGIPEITASDLTAGALRAAILERGCLLVRGLCDSDSAAAVRRTIDEAIDARATGADRGGRRAVYEEFVPQAPGSQLIERKFVEDVGGLWTADSPQLMSDMSELFERAGLPGVVSEYLGERPVVSLQKWTMRKVDRAKVGWHQDGAFLGDVHTLNVWLALSRCGDEAPGLDVVPRRLEEIVATGTEGADYEWSVADKLARETAGEGGIERPVFDAGDALLFDQLLLHGTAADSRPGKVRYACETWFFGPSGFPGDYLPLAL